MKTGPRKPDLLIVGASTRAAAVAVHRAFPDWRLATCDLFADSDHPPATNCTALPFRHFPQGFVAWAEQMPATRLLYTGGVENDPRTIRALEKRHQVLGNSAEVVARVRQSEGWAACCRASGAVWAPRYPKLPPSRSHLRWLRKPTQSCGGWGIDAWNSSGNVGTSSNLDPVGHVGCPQESGSESHASAAGGARYFQPWIPGDALAGLYLAEDGECQLMAVTRSWTLREWPVQSAERVGGGSLMRARPFAYAGSAGPWELPIDQESQWRRLGQNITRTFGLRGLFGVDAIVGPGPEPDVDQPKIYVLECNPRYTASMELCEANDGRWMAGHVRACSPEGQNMSPYEDAGSAANGPSALQGKAILYAPQRLRWSHAHRSSLEELLETPDDAFVDRPRVGTICEQGQPVCSLRLERRNWSVMQREVGLERRKGIFWRAMESLVRPEVSGELAR